MYPVIKVHLQSLIVTVTFTSGRDLSDQATGVISKTMNVLLKICSFKNQAYIININMCAG